MSLSLTHKTPGDAPYNPSTGGKDRRILGLLPASLVMWTRPTFQGEAVSRKTKVILKRGPLVYTHTYAHMHTGGGGEEETERGGGRESPRNK